MAKATVEVTKVPVTTYKDKKEITLSLSLAEAVVLRAICAKIGGNPRTTCRGYADSIAQALDEAEVTCIRLDALSSSASIHFTNIPKAIKELEEM